VSGGAYAAVEWLLSQGEPEARRVAVQQVTKLHGREASELLLRALGDEDWRVRKEAAQIAAFVEPREETVAALIAALEDTMNIGLRNAAVEALVAIGPDAVPAAVDALHKLDADGRKLAVEVLGGVPDMRGVRALAQSLSDEDANVRAAAAEALGNAALAGDEARAIATTALTDVLSASEIFLKLAALDALSRLDAKLPWSLFEPYVDDPMLRRYAVAAAGASREPAAIAALARAVGDSSPTLVREAMLALADAVLGGADDAALVAVARREVRAKTGARTKLRTMARGGEDGRIRGAALVVLGLYGDFADVALLIDALGDDETQDRAERALVLFGPDVTGPLLIASRKAPAKLRAPILSLVASLGGEAPPEALDVFREALAAPVVDVVAAAVRGLAACGQANDLAEVAPFVGHGDARLSSAATQAIAQIAARHGDSARTLLQQIDPSGAQAAVGCAMLRALGESAGADAVAFLDRALAHTDARTRRAAVDALAALGGEAAASSVSFALADEERDVQLAAVRALGQLKRAEPLVEVIGAAKDPALVAAALRALGGADAERAFSAARPLVKHPDAAIACVAVEAIGGLVARQRPAPASEQTRREDAIFEALEHPDAEVVKFALSEIANQPDARALARLGLCLDHDSWEVRRLAAELLGQSGTPSALALLRARYEREKDPVVREAIALAVSVRPPEGTLSTLRVGALREED
jgi:HEAT repeat protein